MLRSSPVVQGTAECPGITLSPTLDTWEPVARRYAWQALVVNELQPMVLTLTGTGDLPDLPPVKGRLFLEVLAGLPCRWGMRWDQPLVLSYQPQVRVSHEAITGMLGNRPTPHYASLGFHTWLLLPPTDSSGPN
jgi:hypothetical protein